MASESSSSSSHASLAPLIRPLDSSADASKGVLSMPRPQSSHPYDPLTTVEISAAVVTVRAAEATVELRDSIRFIEVVLLEPDKNDVVLVDEYFFPPFQPSLHPRTIGDLGLLSPDTLPRPTWTELVFSIAASVLTLKESSEALDLSLPQINKGSRWLQECPPRKPGGVSENDIWKGFTDLPVFPKVAKASLIKELALRMVLNPWPQSDLIHGPIDEKNLLQHGNDSKGNLRCVGCFSEADAPGRRLAKPLIFCRSESDCPMENGYARPVEGIFVLFDMQNMMVIEFEDRKLVPLPPVDPLRNYTSGETRGSSDRTDLKPLQIIQPDGPSFRVNGYFVEWQKWNFRIGFTSKEGLVIYSVAYVVEMVVPYGDPNDPHYRKNAFDVGEDGLGKNAHSLKKGCDCLGYIKYFDAHFTNFTGGVEIIENCVCLHEEDHGILWKHQDWRTGLAEVRRSRRLSVSFICTDGKIEAEVKLTGILSLGALMPGEFRKYGTMIAPGLYAPVHQHFFVARMDMSVDSKPGEALNQVVEVNMKVEEPGENNVHNNAFFAEETLLRSELEAMRDCNSLTACHWIVRNTRTCNRTGQLTGYKLVPGSNCLPLAGSEAKFLRRAAFLKHNFWVTTYSRDEMYVFGITHVPRLEDWPVMPVEHIGFMLMPHGFFNCSPAVDVPPNACEIDSKDNDIKANDIKDNGYSN
ncbi:hypothetical protein Fmac_008889 [Flemingia macrophylla]|uniref:Amine oxidase n=1 Tax=Flemingia macrophylla TaxID=520843 RepID=A0ABD1MYR5_9FABA